ncbi:Hypothetical_protein [Hexamita inflata]|uniref:Hypothetical_protein n=1 Tax=Hexamita inflata TaxID=28002 RepID=A0AA86U0G5_9EUKA|nr:Hypothetical protein HINF_LOCUS21437 [Hexamita inflata]
MFSVLSHFFDSFVLGTPVADNLERWTSKHVLLLLQIQFKPVQLILQNLLNKVAATEQVTTAKQKYLRRVSDAILDLKLKQPQIHILEWFNQFITLEMDLAPGKLLVLFIVERTDKCTVHQKFQVHLLVSI